MKINLYLPFIICSIIFFTGCKKETDTITVTKTDTIKTIVTVHDTVKTSLLDRPIGLTATKGVYGNKIIISWIRTPQAKNFQLFKFDDVTQRYDLLKETTDTSYTDVSITKPLVKVFYKVMVHNSATEISTFSDVDYGYISGTTYDKVFSFGTEGSGPGQFEFNTFVSVDKNGNFYVSDDTRNLVQKFDKNGNFLEVYFAAYGNKGIWFLDNGNTIVTQSQNNWIKILDPNKQVVKQWGTTGAGNGQFSNITQIAEDDEHNLYFADGINNRITKFDANGNYLLSWGSMGTGNGQFNSPWGVCFYKGKIVVTSASDPRVQIFSKNGTFINSFNSNTAGLYSVVSDGTNLYIAAGHYVIKTDDTGSVLDKIGVAEFSGVNTVTGVALTPDNLLVASDVYGRQVVIFKKN